MISKPVGADHSSHSAHETAQADGQGPKPAAGSPASALSQLGEGQIGGALLRITGSMYVGLIAVASVGAVDAYFIGKLGLLELSAFGTAMPFLLLLQAIVLGWGTGVSTIVAFLAGAQQPAAASRLIAQAVAVAVPVGGAIWLLGRLLEQGVFTMLAGGPSAVPLAHAFFLPASIAMAVLVVPISGTFSLRALGRALPSAQVMTLAALVNLVLCPALIFGAGPIPALGIAGAGWAQLIGNLVGATYTLWLIREHLPAWSPVGLGANLRRILGVAVPVTFAQSLAPVAGSIVVGVAGSFGVAAVAALSVIGRVDNVVLMTPLAISTAVQPLVGQFWAGGKPDLVRKTLQLARRGALIWGIALWVVFTLGAAQIAEMMCHDEAVAAIVRTAFPLTALVYVTSAVTNTAGSTLVAIGRAPATLIMSFSSVFCFLPAAIGLLVFVLDLGVTGLFASLPLSAALSTALALFMLHKAGVTSRAPR